MAILKASLTSIKGIHKSIDPGISINLHFKNHGHFEGTFFLGNCSHILNPHVSPMVYKRVLDNIPLGIGYQLVRV